MPKLKEREFPTLNRGRVNSCRLQAAKILDFLYKRRLTFGHSMLHLK